MIHNDRKRIEAAIVASQGQGADVPDDVRHAAVAILLRGSSLSEAEILLMRRAEREGDRWSGQIGLPGGHAEPIDKDLVETARRESREEVGIDPGAEGATLFGALPIVQASARGKRVPLFTTPVVFHRESPEPATLGPEADEAFWLPVALVFSGEIDATHRYEKAGLVHKLPSWDYEGRTIWGMTYGILNRFLTSI